MKNFKNENNKIYSYEDNVSRTFLEVKIKELGLTPILDEELDILRQPTLEIARILKTNKIKILFNKESGTQVEVNKIFYNGGHDSALKLDSAKRMSEIAGLDKVIFYDIDNKGQELSIVDAVTVILTIGTKYQEDFGKYQALKIQISTASIEELKNIIW